MAGSAGPLERIATSFNPVERFKAENLMAPLIQNTPMMTRPAALPPPSGVGVPRPTLSPLTRPSQSMAAPQMAQRPNIQQVIQNLKLLHGQPGI